MDLAANLESVRQRMERACARVGRDVGSVTLLAVAKGQPPQRVREASELGLTLFGENKVQEARIKIGQCPGKLHWHMIGHLQSNKCRDAVHFFEMIQSVDTMAMAKELNKWTERSAKSLPVLLEMNAAGEATKFGFAPGQLLAELPRLNALRRLEIHGLMTIAPWTPEPEKVRPIFRQVRELKQQCEQILGAPLGQL